MIVIVILLLVGLVLAILPWRRVAVGLVLVATFWTLSHFALPANVWEPLVLVSMPPLLLGWLVGLLMRATARRMWLV